MKDHDITVDWNFFSEFISPNDLMFKNIYTTQDWIQEESISSALYFFEEAKKYAHLFGPGGLSLDAQRMIAYTIGIKGYKPPRAIPFKRIDGKGNSIQCFILIDGHHRLYVAKQLKIPMEILIDSSYGNPCIGQARSVEELNNFMCDLTNNRIGCGTNTIHLGRFFQKGISSKFARLEM